MVRYAFLSLNVLNGLLVLAVAAVLHFAVIPLMDPVARISLPPVKETAAPSREQMTGPQRLPAADYAVISEKNLFHPERKVPLEKQPEKAVPKPDVFLYGTLITDDGSYAFIEDMKAPHSTPGRGKRQTTLKKGDRLSGYIVTTIEANRIVLVKGEEKIVVMLDDREKKRSSEAPAVPAAAKTAAGGMSPSIKASLPPAGPPSAPAAASPGPAIAGPPRPSPQPSPPSPSRMTSPSALDAPSRPGIGASGTWPPTRDSMEQTRQKLKDAKQMRMEQLKGSQ